MCGIVGYVGKSLRAGDVLGVLKKLEYRGYDSAGISITGAGEQRVYKALGVIDNLCAKVPKKLFASSAIAHTRWATHGKPSALNAHPHCSSGKLWTIVHNGIIENAEKLKSTHNLQTLGQTDTEVLAQFLEFQGAKDIGGFTSAFESVEGSWAILAQCKEVPNALFVAKNKSPLYTAEDKNGNFWVASDPICFADFAKEYIAFEDGEFAIIEMSKLCVFDKNLNIITKTPVQFAEVASTATKGDYAHFMEKEIFEQPAALCRLVSGYKHNKCLARFSPNFLAQFEQVKFLGCGSAYHAAMYGAEIFEAILQIPASAEVASEFTYSKTLCFEKTLFVFISQSGETADTIRAHELVKASGGQTVVITNVEYSTLAQKADITLGLFAGPEVAVASTKAFVCQLAALYLLAKAMQGDCEDFFAEVETAAHELLNFDMEKIDVLARKLAPAKNALFIGKGLDFVLAREGALKLMEITYINSLAVYAGELKHGYLALVQKKTPLFVFANDESVAQKTLNAATEANARGGEVIEISFLQKNVKKHLLPLLAIVPIQYLAYRVCVLKNLDPDKPRNLAKSVTVE